MRSRGSEAAPRGPVAGVVLAGGRSRRFAPDKLAEEYGGRPLLQHPVSRLLEGCDRGVAVLGEMLRAGLETGVVAVSLSDGGKERPLPCVLRSVPAAEAVGALLRAGRRSLRGLLAAVPTVVIDEPTWTALDPERRTLMDIDEPGDLERG